MTRIGIITAMPTEVWPLVRNWRRNSQPHNGRTFRFFESAEAVVLPGGIGHEAGDRAAKAMIALYRPELLIAAGLAGGLKPQWTLARTLVAAEVIDGGTGQRFRTAGGEGMVVSSRIIAGVEEKRRLASAFPGADVVDMEGAAVAEAATQHGLPFLAVKAVSDNLQFELPPLNQFVDDQGRFQSLRFVAWAAVRPWWWPRIAQLKRISDQAARALADLLSAIIHDQAPGHRAMISGSTATSVTTKYGN